MNFRFKKQTTRVANCTIYTTHCTIASFIPFSCIESPYHNIIFSFSLLLLLLFPCYLSLRLSQYNPNATFSAYTFTSAPTVPTLSLPLTLFQNPGFHLPWPSFAPSSAHISIHEHPPPPYLAATASIMKALYYRFRYHSLHPLSHPSISLSIKPLHHTSYLALLLE